MKVPTPISDRYPSPNLFNVLVLSPRLRSGSNETRFVEGQLYSRSDEPAYQSINDAIASAEQLIHDDSKWSKYSKLPSRAVAVVNTRDGFINHKVGWQLNEAPDLSNAKVASKLLVKPGVSAVVGESGTSLIDASQVRTLFPESQVSTIDAGNWWGGDTIVASRHEVGARKGYSKLGDAIAAASARSAGDKPAIAITKGDRGYFLTTLEVETDHPLGSPHVSGFKLDQSSIPDGFDENIIAIVDAERIAKRSTSVTSP